MKLDRLVVVNFRQFRGRQSVTFSGSPEKNVSVIHGVNGAGKTSLFTAINWCLYEAGADNIGDLINKAMVAESAPGSIVEASVELTFRHGAERFTARRKSCAEVTSAGDLLYEPATDFILMRGAADGQSTRVDNPKGVLNSILSEKARTYFFFDGEKIDNFARPEASDEVREAIYNVLGLEVLTRGQRHLKEAAATFRQTLKGVATGELARLVAEEIEKRTKQEDLQQDRARLEQEIKSARSHLASVEQQLRELEQTRGMQEKLDVLNAQLAQVEEDRQQVIASLGEYANQGYIILVAAAAAKATALLNEKRQRGEIPSNIREQFVRDLLGRLQCICGRPFHAHDAAYQHLEQLLVQAVPSTLEDDVLTTAAVLPTLVSRAADLQADLSTAMARRSQLDQRFESLHDQSDDIARQLKTSDQDAIQALGRSREAYLADIDRYTMEKLDRDYQLSRLAQELEGIRRDKEYAARKEARVAALEHQEQLAQAAADALKEVYHAFAEDMRQRIEQEAQRIFHLLLWKESTFQSMSLDKDYKLEVYDRWGKPARPELSAGERQVLSLSFIMAMANVSGDEAPLVMDTPFGRISSQTRENIAAHIPEMAKQLVLFVTDEELRDRAMEIVRPRIGAEYELVFDQHISCTRIEEVH